MLADCHSDPWKQTSVKFQSQYKYFHSRKHIWKCGLQNITHFELRLVFPPFIQGHVVMGQQAVSPYQQVIEKTKGLAFRSQMLIVKIEKTLGARSSEVCMFCIDRVWCPGGHYQDYCIGTHSFVQISATHSFSKVSEAHFNSTDAGDGIFLLKGSIPCLLMLWQL